MTCLDPACTIARVEPMTPERWRQVTAVFHAARGRERDGKELVYWSPPGGIHAHDVSLSASDIRVGPRRTLLDRPVLSLIDGRTHYDITRDGQRLLVRHPAGPQGAGIKVILNWTSKLKR